MIRCNLGLYTKCMGLNLFGLAFMSLFWNLYQAMCLLHFLNQMQLPFAVGLSYTVYTLSFFHHKWLEIL